MDKPTKAFGRFHDLIIIVIGFVLTTLVGGYLTQAWQTRAAEIDRTAEHKRFEQAASTKLFEELSRIMDKRLYRMRRVHNSLGQIVQNVEEKRKRWESYREVLFEWNENLNRNLALVQRYFGDEARDILERDIQGGFIQFGKLLEGGVYPDNGKTKYQQRQEVADALNNIIYKFDIQMITAIQEGQVGAFKENR